MIRVSLDRPWLVADLPRPMRVTSWAPHRPGLVETNRIVWREVRDEDLGPGFDAEGWLGAAMAARGWAGAVGLLTSRDLSAYHLAQAAAGGVRAACLATVGLGNAESVGRRIGTAPHVGTVNIAVAVDTALTPAAQLEALSIAVEARTAAIMAHGPDLPTGRATGTGTDCVALACDPGEGRYAGLHTAAGEAVGAAVLAAVAEGVRAWLKVKADDALMAARPA
ncbi:adenosylcobinamide hydrolase [Cereibacter ovatus]|uniref:Adenosylcobinamide hydrolase n=1 Tax=Cereibacter ovatus TaxID=439529 RepID=A0A285D5J2_9RHOB|nr:adenosylcobinamide amidohydrolase [Cereibacter ovatus]SNX74616.1 adenosylcobinamide hydrolase [Cereibacter ovatus]